MKFLSFFILLAVTCSCAPTSNLDEKPTGFESLPDCDNNDEKPSHLESLPNDLITNIITRCEPILTSKLFSQVIKSRFSDLELTESQEAAFNSMTDEEKRLGWKLANNDDFINQLEEKDWPLAVKVAVKLSNRRITYVLLARAPYSYLDKLFCLNVFPVRNGLRKELEVFEKVLTKTEIKYLSEIQDNWTTFDDVRFLVDLIRNAEFIAYPSNMCRYPTVKLGLRFALEAGNVQAAWKILSQFPLDLQAGLEEEEALKFKTLVEMAEKQFTETKLHDLMKLRTADDDFFYSGIILNRYGVALEYLKNRNKAQQEFGLQLAMRYGDRQTTIALLALGMLDSGKDWEERGGIVAEAMHDLGESDRAVLEIFRKHRAFFLALINEGDRNWKIRISDFEIDTEAAEYGMHIALVTGTYDYGEERRALALLNWAKNLNETECEKKLMKIGQDVAAKGRRGARRWKLVLDTRSSTTSSASTRTSHIS